MRLWDSKDPKVFFLSGVAIYILTCHVALRIGGLPVSALAQVLCALASFFVIKKMEIPEVLSRKNGGASPGVPAKMGLFSILLAYASSYFFSGVLALVAGGYQVGPVIPEGGKEGGLLFLFYIMILAPMAEELLFRGLIFTSVERVLSSSLAAGFISSVMFAAVHSGVYQIAFSFMMGIVLSYIYYMTRSLSLIVFIHGAHNALLALRPESMAAATGEPSDIAFLVVAGAASVYTAFRMYQHKIN